MTRLISPSLALAAISGIVFMSGCGAPEPSADPGDLPGEHVHPEGGHHHAETYPEAVKEIAGFRDEIRDAFAANDEPGAHEPLHEVAHVLELLPGLIRKSDLTEEQKVAAKEAGDKLFELFGKVDAVMHGKEGSSYADVSDEIDAAVAVLEDPAATEAAPAADAPAAKDAPTEETPANSEETPAEGKPAAENSPETPALEPPANP